MKNTIAVLTAPGKFDFDEYEVEVKPGHLLIKILVCGLCIWEENHFAGRLGKCPQTLGHEWSGEVVEVGDGVEGFMPGDMVSVLPDELFGFATYACVPAKSCYHIADGIDPKTVLGEPVKCVVTVLRSAEVQPGDYAVVSGCGSMGLWCIQVLSKMALSKLIAIDLDETRLELARKYGADVTLNPGNTNVQEKIREITGGRMADFVIDGCGSPAVIVDEIGYLRGGRGKLILMSSHAGPAPSMDFRPAIEKGIEIRVPHPIYSLDPHDDMRRAINLFNGGVFKTEGIITHEFNLKDIQKGFETMAAKTKGYIKGVVYPT